jgi:hypothetical protein
VAAFRHCEERGGARFLSLRGAGRGPATKQSRGEPGGLGARPAAGAGASPLTFSFSGGEPLFEAQKVVPTRPPLLKNAKGLPGAKAGEAGHAARVVWAGVCRGRRKPEERRALAGALLPPLPPRKKAGVGGLLADPWLGKRNTVLASICYRQYSSA